MEHISMNCKDKSSKKSFHGAVDEQITKPPAAETLLKITCKRKALRNQVTEEINDFLAS